MRQLATKDGVALFVADDAVWARHRRTLPPTTGVSPVFAIPRDRLFKWMAPDDDPGVVRVADLLSRLGLDPAALKRRLGGG
jgi:hypothetical protein